MEQNIEHVAHWVEGQTNNPNVHNIICSHCTDAEEIHRVTPCGSCGVDKKNFE